MVVGEAGCSSSRWIPSASAPPTVDESHHGAGLVVPDHALGPRPSMDGMWCAPAGHQERGSRAINGNHIESKGDAVVLLAGLFDRALEKNSEKK